MSATAAQPVASSSASDSLGGGGPPLEHDEPVPVVTADGTPLAGATALGVGARHACAAVAGGEVYCWGERRG
ncbi:MAG TPA: RCC1 domain-containing protein [Polyangiaceae bacterium]|nr:RCC1 domain-containing protein [Polyangiaceae bacterium]